MVKCLQEVSKLGIGERIKAVRESYGLSGDEFGREIGLGKSSISLIENGKNKPRETTLLLICRKFGVNEGWLRTGEGEMFRATTRAEQIAAFVGEALADEPESTRQRLLYALTRLPDKGWQLLDAFLDDLAAPPPGKEE